MNPEKPMNRIALISAMMAVVLIVCISFQFIFPSYGLKCDVVLPGTQCSLTLGEKISAIIHVISSLVYVLLMPTTVIMGILGAILSWKKQQRGMLLSVISIFVVFVIQIFLMIAFMA